MQPVILDQEPKGPGTDTGTDTGAGLAGTTRRPPR